MSYQLTISITKEILQRSAMCGKHEGWTVKNAPNEYPTNCAIALAVRDIFPGAYVGCELIDPFGEFQKVVTIESYKVILLPKPAIDFIKEFDELEPVDRMLMKPFSFDVRISNYILDRIDISEALKALENHPNLLLQTV